MSLQGFETEISVSKLAWVTKVSDFSCVEVNEGGTEATLKNFNYLDRGLHHTVTIPMGEPMTVGRVYKGRLVYLGNSKFTFREVTNGGL